MLAFVVVLVFPLPKVASGGATVGQGGSALEFVLVGSVVVVDVGVTLRAAGPRALVAAAPQPNVELGTEHVREVH